MPAQRPLPQLDGVTMLTDGGLETTLVFHEGIDLPFFAAFPLLRDEDGRAALRRYFERYVEIARERELGLVLEAPTWRANPDWGARLGYSSARLADANRAAVELLAAIRDDAAGVEPVVVSGCVGPQDDGYVPASTLSTAGAEEYHSAQIRAFAAAGADMACAITMTYAEEAVGVARAAAAEGLPVAISFTVETDGRLPSGQPLGEAIDQVDAETGGTAAYFMVNCAHPTHFEPVLEHGAPWLERIGGLRANASRKSHAELDASEELDDGNPDELAADYVRLRRRLPNLTVLGGCCGTDHRHVGAIAAAWGASAA